ncbi:MAG: SIMPL domain-containing protein [bacterium]|nr:SIMPL domain-containing protein [bacterium]
MSDWVVKLAATVILVLAAVFAYGKLGPAIPFTSTVTQKQDFLTVTGEGKVTVVPDTAMVSLGVVASQTTISAAQNQANTAINNITTTLKSLGIDSKDIKTSNYSISPQYDYRDSGSPNRITGYQVNVSVSVTVRDIDKINDVIDRSTAAGANTVGGILLTIDEDKQKELVQQARGEAIKEAKSKAESLAKAAGITLGRIVNIQEGGSSIIRPMYDVAFKALPISGGGEPTQIEPGSTDITSSVTLFYETR